MFDALLSIDVLDGPIPFTVFGLAGALFVALLARRPSLRRLRTLGLAVACGLLAAVVSWLICVRWLNLFGEGLGMGNYLWVAAAYCGVAVAAVSIGRTPRWRTVVAIVAAPVFVAAAALGINADYGLDRTLGNLLAITVPSPIKVAPLARNSKAYDVALWKDWKAPADMPLHGKTGTAHIPGTRSGFHAREAGIYLPPAALVARPPALPLVVMMMGQPGNPDPEPIATAMNALAAQHHGLAPVVVVADQIGPGMPDTMCLDTARYGNAASYITRDVTEWAAAHLPITRDHRFWSVAGYSNGGLCALTFGIDHPDLFSNVLDMSGEEYPGAEHPATTLTDFFHGDKAAYERAKPLNRLAPGAFPGSMIFSASRDDPVYHAVALQSLRAAERAGIASAFIDIPTGGHGMGALMGGLNGGLPLLFATLGLQKPG
ncbi:alpha/beta hydrolase [Streptomyces sp. L7]|uniref:alpha/beta hydrolase n=1 Tax=Streptomyces sp. L7 TaxID=3423954 RepID=UPI003D954919